MAVPGSTGAGFPYAVAMGRDELAVVAFQRHSMRVTVREHGRWTAVARPVSSGRGGTGAPAVAVTSTGEIVVAWMQDTLTAHGPSHGPYYIRAAVRDRRGRWSRARSLGISRHALEPQITIAAHRRGDAMVAWRGLTRDRRGRSHDAFQSSVWRAGGSFQRARTVADAAATPQVAPTVPAGGMRRGRTSDALSV